MQVISKRSIIIIGPNGERLLLPADIMPKRVPDWVKDTNEFELGVKAGLLSEFPPTAKAAKAAQAAQVEEIKPLPAKGKAPAAAPTQPEKGFEFQGRSGRSA